MANREARARIAAETVAITRSGMYTEPSGAVVEIGEAVRLAVHRTQLFVPGDLRVLCDRAQTELSMRSFTTSFEVKNETTFATARRLVAQYGPDRVAALNFASAKNPGGGFLSGSQAQEESLARASALCACLESQMAYYDANRAATSLLYTDHMIVSSGVPVFRDNDDQLLESPWQTAIITVPAPNAAAIAKNDPASLASVEPTFRQRVEYVLAAAVVSGHAALVLGAWGCGVFGNDPAIVARLFGEFLQGGGKYAKAFEHVTFAVLDRGTETIGAFQARFAQLSSPA
jgi:uncharacterized protein (TIGR02452 family)